MANQHKHSHGNYHRNTAHNHTTENIKLAFFLNVSFTLVEFVGGILTNSTAILADAVHDLGDSIALGQAWYFQNLTTKKPSHRFTYGYKRLTVLAALISTLFILLSSFYVLTEAVPRILQPETPHAPGMVVLAIIGIAVNGYAMIRLAGESGVNARTVALHLLEDVLGWVAILVVAFVLLFKDIPILDPILAILITLYILNNVIKNVRAIVPIFLQAAPEAVNLKTLQDKIEQLPDVETAHHLHIWSLDDEHEVFSVHLVADKNLDSAQYVQLKNRLRELIEQYGFYHSTVEVEMPQECCRMTLSNDQA